MTSRALVVEEGRTRGALAAVRALAAAGWAVGVGSPGATGLAAASRYVSRCHAVPRPHHGVDAFLSAVRSAVADGGYDVVLAAGDAELMTLAWAPGGVGAALPHPPYDVLTRAIDKLALAELADEVGLASPETVLADPAAVQRWRGPGMVKARWHWRPDSAGGDGRVEAARVDGPESAAAAAAAVRAAGGDPVLQRLVDGELIAFACVADGRGGLAGRVQQRALRIWPPGAGVSVRAETVAVDPELERGVTALLARLGWVGIAEVQFLVPSGGQPHLVDLNGRIYGSLALAVAAGVNLPAIAASLAVGRKPPLAAHPRVGMRYHWLEGDLHALRQGSTHRVAAVGEMLRWARDSTGAVWDPEDRRPAYAQTRHVLARAVRRR